MTGVPFEGAVGAFASGDPDGLRARAIVDGDDLQVLTGERQEDARRAMARGLREYLEGLAINWVGGRLLKWEKVAVEWAEPEEPLKFPALSVVGDGPGTYDDSQLTPTLIELGDDAADTAPRWLKEVSAVTQTFVLVVWATDPIARSGLVAMLEDALEPATFMSGLRLELPHYFNARATYEKLSIFYEDNDANAHRRWRKARIQVMASVPQYVPQGAINRLQPSTTVELEDGANTPLSIEAVLVSHDDNGPTQPC